jgi:hypothetical protein
MYQYIDRREDAMDLAGWLGALALWAIPSAYILLRGLPTPRRSQLREWADAFGLVLTEANQGVVEHYLRRTRRFRTVGAVLGLLFATLVLGFTAGRASNTALTNGLLTAAAGYLLGAVIAEAFLSHPRRTAPRAASLEPRTLDQYLPRYAVLAQRGLPALALAFIPLYVVLRTRPSLIPSLSLTGFAGAALLIVSLGVALEVVERMIVRRAQPVVGQDLLRADEAIRSSSIHALAGAGVALQLLGLGYQLNAMATTRMRGADWGFMILAFLTLVLALSSWIELGHPKRWQVRRRTWQENRA